MAKDPVFPQLKCVSKEKVIQEIATRIWNKIRNDVIPENGSIGREEVVAIMMDQFRFHLPSTRARDVFVFKTTSVKEREGALRKMFLETEYEREGG